MISFKWEELMGHQNRKSTTILAMDVAGYSAKMNENEAGVVAQLKNSQKIIEEIAAKKAAEYLIQQAILL